MEKPFQKAIWACVLAFLVLLGSWSLIVDIRSAYFHTPLQGIAMHRRGMEFSADRVSEPPTPPTRNRLRRRNPPPEPPPPPGYSPPVPPPPHASPNN